MAPLNLYRAARLTAALILVFVGARHVLQAFEPNEPAMRHWIFVGINIGLAALLVWRHRWAFGFALALTVQQMWSHGIDLARSFNGTTPLDWRSLLVCLFFPTLDTILFMERRDEADDAREPSHGAREP